MLCVDHESLELQIKAQKVLDEMLIRLKKEEAVSSSNNHHPSWLVELAHRKVFTISETVSNPAFTENLFHEEKTLEKHLASLHGFLTLLKAIEDSSLLLYSDTYVIQLLDALTFLGTIHILRRHFYSTKLDLISQIFTKAVVFFRQIKRISFSTLHFDKNFKI